MKLIFGYIKIIIKHHLYYNVASLWSFFSNFVMFTIQVSLWKYVTEYNKTGDILNFKEFVQYFALCAFIRPFIDINTDRLIQSKYYEGEIIFDIAKPLSTIRLFFSRDIANAIFSLLTVSLPLIFFSSLLYKIQYDLSILQVVFFLISIFLSFSLSWCIAYCIGLFIFFAKNNEGLIQFKLFIIPLLSGGIIPLKVLPEPFKTVFYLLPFRSLFDIPIKIMNYGHSYELFRLLSIQFFWLFVLCTFTHFFNKNGLKKIEIMGG